MRTAGQHHDDIDITVQVKRHIRRQRRDAAPQIRAGKTRLVACLEIHPLADNIDDLASREGCDER